VILTPIKIHSS